MTKETTEATVDYDSAIEECQKRIAEAIANETIDIEAVNAKALADKEKIRKDTKATIVAIRKEIAAITKDKREAKGA